jgi:hypothetical protein
LLLRSSLEASVFSTINSKTLVLEAAMIKMQIIMDDDKIARENKLSPERVHQRIDDYLVGQLGLKKNGNGFYLGFDPKKDFSYFGLAFNTLRKTDWFVDNVKSWLYFNSDASYDPDDFVVEDCLEFIASNRAIA